MDLLQRCVRELIILMYGHHQDNLNLSNVPAVIRHFARGYRLQRQLGLWDDEEWNLICTQDIPNYFKTRPEALNLHRQEPVDSRLIQREFQLPLVIMFLILNIRKYGFLIHTNR